MPLSTFVKTSADKGAALFFATPAGLEPTTFRTGI